MKKKQILIWGKVLTYYQWWPHLTSPSQGEENNIATSYLLKKERIERGSVLVFLHGWMQDGKSFEKIFKVLEEKNIPYLSLDLPGFWWSQLHRDDMTIYDYSEIVKEYIEKLSLKNPVLLGHSFGGRICIHLGSYYANISKIVLICAAWVQRKIPTWKYIIIKTAKVVLSLPWLRGIWSKLREWFSSPDMKNAGKMTKIFKNTISQDLQESMKKNTFQTLMIWWKDDDQTPVWDAQIIHSHMKNSELHILEGTHFIHQEKPEELSEMILEFIQKQ